MTDQKLSFPFTGFSHTMLPVVKKMYFVWVSLVHTALIPPISDGLLSTGSITGSGEEVSAKLQTESGKSLRMIVYYFTLLTRNLLFDQLKK